jgi:hypothetical protein
LILMASFQTTEYGGSLPAGAPKKMSWKPARPLSFAQVTRCDANLLPGTPPWVPNSTMGCLASDNSSILFWIQQFHWAAVAGECGMFANVGLLQNASSSLASFDGATVPVYHWLWCLIYPRSAPTRNLIVDQMSLSQYRFRYTDTSSKHAVGNVYPWLFE